MLHDWLRQDQNQKRTKQFRLNGICVYDRSSIRVLVTASATLVLAWFRWNRNFVVRTSDERSECVRRRAVPEKPGNQGSLRRRTRTSPRRDALESRNETSAALETRDDSYYFRLSNDPSVASVRCFSSMPGISFTERLIDNQPAEAAGQIVSIDCHFRRHSTLSKIASLTLRSFDYFSPVCNGVRPRVVDDVRRTEKKRKKRGHRAPGSDNIDEEEAKELSVVARPTWIVSLGVASGSVADVPEIT